MQGITFRDKGFGDILGDPLSRTLFPALSKLIEEKVLMWWTRHLSRVIPEIPPSLREALARRAHSENQDSVQTILDRMDDADLVRAFPANALMIAFRQVNHSDGKTSWSSNDVVDLFHVALAAYCDASFLDAKTASKVNRAQKLLGLKTTAVPNAQALASLETAKA